MPTPTPTLETVLAAIKTRMDTVAGIGTVFTSEHTIEDEFRFARKYRDAGTGELKVWLVDVTDIPEEEGDSVGEVYSFYRIRIRCVTVLVNDADWVKKTRQKIELVRDELSGNAAVFGIGPQRQIKTPETISLTDFGPRTMGDQLYVKGELSLTVEARRWT